MRAHSSFVRVRTFAVGVLTMVCATVAWGQERAPEPPAGAAPMQTSGDAPAFSQEQLDQMFAPIALYPDELLSQILMASTYPLEIVQADRWVKSNGDVKSDAAAKALESENWDPSVKSLVNFPDVLAMLSDKLDWTQDIGDAFIGQQQDVMASIQRLRGKAKGAGNLETTEQQTVTVEQQGSTQIIQIESADPEVIYVPSADTTVVYGAWAYPSYPPYPYYPPGYAATAMLSFGVGVACGAAWGYAWGDCDWHGGDVDIDIDRNTNINNKNIDRGKYKNQMGQNGRGNFQHNPQHRGSVPYRNQQAAQRYGGTSRGQAAQSRDAYRGRTGTDSLAGASQRDRAGTANRGGQGTRGGGLEGVNRGGKAAQRDSNRGRGSQAGAGRSGGGRAAGGGGRGGGGRGGGGRGGGGRGR